MKKLITTITLSMVALLGMTLPVFADTSGEDQVNFNMISGDLSLETSPIETFGDINLESTPKTHKTSFEEGFTVVDLRGTHEGWRVDVTASQFEVVEPEGGFASGTSAHKLPVGSLSLSPLDSINRVGEGSGELPTSEMTANAIIDDGAVTVAKADVGTGMGEYSLNFSDEALSLVIDSSTALMDTVNYEGKTPYVSTLTWDLISAP